MWKRKPSVLSNGSNCMEKYSSFDNLPKEIMFEIMFRLPTKSLISLKSLNKSWNFLIQCLIDDPDFEAKHRSLAEKDPSMLVIKPPPHEPKTRLSKFRRPRLRSSLITRLVANGTTHCVTENINLSRLPNSLTRDRRSSFEVYHCNGIIGFAKDSMKTFTLYNSVTRKFETFRPKRVRGAGHVLIGGMGFGDDSGGNNFKVVRIMNTMRAQIFAPGSSDSWREIEISIQDRQYRCMYEHVYLKGYCFWIAYGFVSCTVLCFDVCTEAFREVTLPEELDGVGGNFRLGTVGDSVCWFSYPYKEPIDVWVADIKSFSWKKWLRIDNSKGLLRPLAFWGSDELLMKTVKGEMVSYNIQTQFRIVSPKVTLTDVFYLGFYVKSLASVKWVK